MGGRSRVPFKAYERTSIRALVKPLMFHLMRRDEVLHGMKWDARCSRCMVDGSAWTMLVWKMFSEMDARLLELGCARYRRVPEMDACWTEKCPGCGRLVYDRLGNSVKPRLVRLVTLLFFTNGISSSHTR